MIAGLSNGELLLVESAPCAPLILPSKARSRESAPHSERGYYNPHLNADNQSGARQLSTPHTVKVHEDSHRPNDVRVQLVRHVRTTPQRPVGRRRA